MVSTGRHRRIGRAVVCDAPLTLQGPLPWTLEAHYGLLRTFGAEGALPTAQLVSTGVAQLWRVGGDTWIVTERFEDFLWIHCLQGHNAVRCIEIFGRIARENGLNSLRFASAHRQAKRVKKMRSMRHLQPRVFPLECAGEYEIQIEARFF